MLKMLSRISLQTAQVGKHLSSHSQFNPLARISTAALDDALSRISPEEKENFKYLLKERPDSNVYYEGPQRDHVNFPRIHRPTYTPATRMGFLPDSWFQFFYEKTGVTGPYLFGAGLVNFLYSKEIMVMDHEFHLGISLAAIIIFTIKNYGPGTRKYYEGKVKEDEDDFEKFKNGSIEVYEDLIKQEKKIQWSMEGQKWIADAKKENVFFQLEAEYRRRVQQVYEDVRRRLDYQVASQNLKRQMEQNHMVNWIIEKAVKGITPQQEDEALKKCFADLKLLASKQ